MSRRILVVDYHLEMIDNLLFAFCNLIDILCGLAGVTFLIINQS